MDMEFLIFDPVKILSMFFLTTLLRQVTSVALKTATLRAHSIIFSPATTNKFQHYMAWAKSPVNTYTQHKNSLRHLTLLLDLYFSFLFFPLLEPYLSLIFIGFVNNSTMKLCESHSNTQHKQVLTRMAELTETVTEDMAK